MLLKPWKYSDRARWWVLIAFLIFHFWSIFYGKELANRFSEGFIKIITLSVLFSAAALALVILWHYRRARAIRSGSWWFLRLIGTLAAYGFLIHLIPRTIEIMHLIQYGLLAVLLAWVLRPYRPDRTLYPLAGLIMMSLGILDETVQLLLPKRFGDFHDMAINAGAGLVTLAAIRYVAGFASVEKTWSRQGRDWILLAIIAMLFFFDLFVFLKMSGIF